MKFFIDISSTTIWPIISAWLIAASTPIPTLNSQALFGLLTRATTREQLNSNFAIVEATRLISSLPVTQATTSAVSILTEAKTFGSVPSPKQTCSSPNFLSNFSILLLIESITTKSSLFLFKRSAI